MKKTERRFIQIAQTGDGEGFSGTLLRFGDERKLGANREAVAPEANVKIRADIMLNHMHQSHMLIAAADTEFLDIERGSERIVATLNQWPETTTAQESKAQYEAGLLRGLSMEYVVNDAVWEDDLRIIKDIDIVDLAMVHRPAFPDSKINRAWDGYEDPPEPPQEDWL